MNKIFEFVLNLKNEYSSKFNISYDYPDTYKSIVEYWASMLKQNNINDYYFNVLKHIQTTQYDNLVLLRYGQYSDVFYGEYDYMEFWDNYNGIYKHCRSIVIDIVNSKIVIYPFDKFFNLNEREETSTKNVLEKIKGAFYISITDKLDGSMMCARYYNNEYIMSGSKSLDPNNSWRLADGYNYLTNNYKQMLKDYQDTTFIFEYISKEDVHVVIYNEKQYGLNLIGARSEDGIFLTYKELKEIANKYNIKITTLHEITFEEMLESLKKYKSNEKEGYVLHAMSLDYDFFVKIKCDDYIEMHKILSALSSINLIIKHIGDETFDDFFSKIPNTYKSRVLDIAHKVFEYNFKMKSNVTSWCQYLDSYKYDNIKDKMIYITNYVPKNIQGYVREYVKTGNICQNYIKKKNSYIKFKEIESC